MLLSAMTVILVENNSPMLELYTRELSKKFRMLSFSDTEGVLDAIETKTILAVIMEVELPSGKGWELLKTIKQNFDFPLILFSTMDIRKKALEAKVDAYLQKPVSPATLTETLIQVCGLIN